MKQPSKIATALNAWLTFEAMCGRTALFSESYIAFPLGQLLAAKYGGRLESEIRHPVLASQHAGRGDKPRLDFVVRRLDSTLELAIETKWLSSSATLIRDIIRDLVRLELVVHSDGAEAWLILAGQTEDFQKLSAKAGFQGHPQHFSSEPILPYGNSRDGRLRLNPPAQFRRNLLSAALEPFAGIELTECIHVTKFGPYPEPPLPKGFVTFLWRVNPRHALSRFKYEDVFGSGARC